jgi:microsomal dipeptidase-like Zn-dependent dipeptidase
MILAGYWLIRIGGTTGYSFVDIAKILGGNWMRVFRGAWNA